MGSKLKTFKILIVDDSELQRMLYKKHVLYPDDKGEFQFEIYEARTGEEAKKIIERFKPDLVLLDYNLPDLKGTDIIKWIEEKGYGDIQVILVSSIDNEEVASKGLNLGAEDFVKIPYKPEELRARIKVHLRLRRMLKEREKFKRLSLIDQLTRIPNRRYLFQELKKYFKRHKEEKKPLALLMIDVDDFKKVNDTYGHEAGDEILKKVANIISRSVRKFDLVGRYGGEEFIVVLPDADIEKAVEIAERIRKNVESQTFMIDSNEIKVTVSLGVAELLKDNPRSVNDLIKIADMRMYRAKVSGKNRVVFQ